MQTRQLTAGAVLLVVTIGTFARAASVQHTFRLESLKVEESYPVGTSMPVDLVLTNASRDSEPLIMSSWGTPNSPVQVKVTDTRGKEVLPPIKGEPFEGPPPRVPESEFYYVPAGESVRLRFCLSAFAPLKAGTYVLRVTDTAGTLAEVELRVFDIEGIQRKEVTGAYPGISAAPPKNATPVTCRVSMARPKGASLSRRWAIVDSVRVYGALGDLPSYALEMPAGSELVDAQMDFMGNVWMTVRDGKQNGLFVWRLCTKEFLALVPLAEQKVEMGTTRAFSHINGQSIVIGGAVGKPKFSTLSLDAKP